MRKKEDTSTVNICFSLSQPSFLLLFQGAPSFVFRELPDLHHRWYWYGCQSAVPSSLWSEEQSAGSSQSSKPLFPTKSNVLRGTLGGKAIGAELSNSSTLQINSRVPATEITKNPGSCSSSEMTAQFFLWSPSCSIVFQLIPSSCLLVRVSDCLQQPHKSDQLELNPQIR